MLIGALVFVLIFLRGENTRTQVGVIKREIRVIREAAPCTGLTRRECAVYLLGALSESQKRSIGISERRLAQLEHQTVLERERAARNGTSQIIVGGKRRKLTPDLPVAKPKPSPRRPGSTSPQPPPQSPAPLVQTPGVTTPPLGPVGPIVIPGITVQCADLKPISECERG